MLHRLAETKVDAEGQGSDELREPQPRLLHRAAVDHRQGVGHDPSPGSVWLSSRWKAQPFRRPARRTPASQAVAVTSQLAVPRMTPCGVACSARTDRRLLSAVIRSFSSRSSSSPLVLPILETNE